MNKITINYKKNRYYIDHTGPAMTVTCLTNIPECYLKNQ